MSRPARGESMLVMAAEKKSPPLRVMLVDDHEVVRGGIRALLIATSSLP